ncbi:MAG TPA: ThuA domain-containing protein, partial [Arthrobacter sp.]|nr:ThuA domain-containing protein [Arthrobacter sp.]
MTDKLNILVWNEGVHEARNQPESMAEMYPAGMHGTIADGLRGFYPDAAISTATLADPEHGLSEETLAATDVLLWWGHWAHDEVSDEAVERVQRHVLGGMGLVVL